MVHESASASAVSVGFVTSPLVLGSHCSQSVRSVHLRVRAIGIKAEPLRSESAAR